MRRRAFTLVEMITVIAITAILMSLIIVPLVQSFNLTRAAQGFSEAQDKARRLIESISREIINSSGIRDNEGDKGSVGVRIPGRPVNLGGTNNGLPEFALIRYGKIDILKPAEGDPANRRDGAYIDPDTGMADPTLKSPRGQVVLPTGPGATMVRYWIGLRSPLKANTDDPDLYQNPYDGLLMARGGDRDNLYVLYRAEVQVLVIDPATNQFRVNPKLFEDANNDLVPDDIDDPWFFVQDSPGQTMNRATKAQRIRNWLHEANIVTEFARYDMIQPIYQKQTRVVTYDGNVPRLLPLIQFKPTRVSSEPAGGRQAVRLGEETDNAAGVSSDVFKTDFGSWSNAIVRLYPFDWNPNDPNKNHYSVGRTVDTPNGQRFRIFRYDPDNDTDGNDKNGEGNPADDVEFMDVTTYDEFISRGVVYAFTRAVLDSDSRSGWLANVNLRNEFAPYFPDPKSGKLITSFPISEVGVDVPTGGVRRPDNNLPTVATGASVSPIGDPNPPGNFWDYENDINRRFNKVWADYPSLRPNIHRFVDLRIAPNADGANGPLNPLGGFIRGQIVPGSEVVIGPDQNPGPNYGAAIRYTRTTRTPGPNQYRLNYVDQVEPNYALLGFANPPAQYDRQDFVSAVIQPRYKAGYLQLNSDPNVPLPVGNISVYYRFQMTRPGDTVAVDYDTRNIISIRMTIRNYPQTTIPNPQDITLTATAAVRNYVR